ncbi:hypothetical protein MAJ_10877, partial [Metarhizium majus ARSEF 297]
MSLQVDLPKDLGPSARKNKSIQDLVSRMKSELCEDWLDHRVDDWGPCRLSEDLTPSWTSTIATKAGDTTHYITCPVHLHGDQCTGAWCRKERQTMAIGLHCVYGGLVSWNGQVVTDVHPTLADGQTRSLQQLRRLWAEHVLSQRHASRPSECHLDGILDQDAIDQVHELMEKAIRRRMDGIEQEREKTFGKGTGGWSGLTNNGTVLKRAPGRRRICNYQDRTDAEPGGMWERGDAEVWITWNGWSGLVTRDGRWRPGYHFEVHTMQWLTVVDYGLTRELFRDWQSGWLQTSEWALVNTPLDVPRSFVGVFGRDVGEMIRREKQRSQMLKPQEYVADDTSTIERRYRCLQDRAGNVIAYHTVGEALDTPRGLVATWCMAAVNDIVDYERDVLCGESNNIARGLTSDQQMVDTAACVLDAVCWSIDNYDYDLLDAILGSTTLYLVMWRYNGPKLARYKPISILNQRRGIPPEIKDIVEMVRSGGTAVSEEYETYGDLYRQTLAKVRRALDDCTCCRPMEGHDAWELIAKAMDEQGNDDLEERLHVACVAINNGANAGDIKSECGMDLLNLECFIRTFDPETGVVARLHYRSDNKQYGNTITE